MQKQGQRVVRQGSIYHVMIEDTDYAMFIWSAGKRFCGRVEGHPQVLEQNAATALGVCNALRDLLITMLRK
jgi:hypothetical protein